MTRLLILLASILIVLVGFVMFRDLSKDSQTIPPLVTTNPISNEPNFHEWNEFSSEQGQFKVLLPILPQHVSEKVIDPKTLEQRKYETFASAADNGAAFIINVISLPESSKPNEESLKAAVTDMLERNKENQLNHMEMGRLNENPSLDFSLSNKDVLIEGKILAHDNKMYVLSMISKKDSFNKKEFDFFVHSFDFINEKPEKQH